MAYQRLRNAILASAALTLGACGGGGGGGTNFIPSPPVTPAPEPPPPPPPPPGPTETTLDIIDAAPTGNLAVAGASATGSVADPDQLKDASLAAGDQPQMRYDAATKTYEIKLPAGSWETLWTKDTSLPEWRRSVGIGQTLGTIVFNIDREVGTADAYPYSTLAAYSGEDGRFGTVAVGIPTDAANVPTTGSATYQGVIAGTSDVLTVDLNGFEAWPHPIGVSGTVTLSFNFSNGTLGGAMEPKLGTESLGTFTFKDGVYSAGTYSGQFNTSATGINGFNGQVTGPHGEELIGGWALPFHYSGDGADHEAIGAWVAGRTP